MRKGARTRSKLEQQRIDFLHEPTLEKYLTRRNTGLPEEIPVIATRMRAKFIDSELQSYGVGVSVAGILDIDLVDGDATRLDELCMTLLRAIAERRSRENCGERHLQSRKKVIPDSLINFTLLFILEWHGKLYGTHINTALGMLLRERLVGGNSSHNRQFTTMIRKFNADVIAAQILRSGETPTLRKVAGELGVNVSTMSRWYGSENIESRARQLCAEWDRK